MRTVPTRALRSASSARRTCELAHPLHPASLVRPCALHAAWSRETLRSSARRTRASGRATTGHPACAAPAGQPGAPLARTTLLHELQRPWRPDRLQPGLRAQSMSYTSSVACPMTSARRDGQYWRTPNSHRTLTWPETRHTAVAPVDPQQATAMLRANHSSSCAPDRMRCDTPAGNPQWRADA